MNMLRCTHQFHKHYPDEVDQFVPVVQQSHHLTMDWEYLEYSSFPVVHSQVQVLVRQSQFHTH